jgi:hypothetical protein
LSIVMDRDLTDVQGIRGDFSIQKCNGSTALFLCDQGNVVRDKSPVLVWRLHIIVCNPFQPGPSAKDRAGATFDVWKRVGIPTRCDPDAYHIGKIAEVMNDRKGPNEPSITSSIDDRIGWGSRRSTRTHGMAGMRTRRSFTTPGWSGLHW